MAYSTSWDRALAPSLGVTLHHAALGMGETASAEILDLSPDTIARRLALAGNRLGTASPAASVYAAYASGALARPAKRGTPVVLPPLELTALRALALGVGTAEQARRTGESEGTVRGRILVLRDRLTTFTDPGAVHRGWVLGILDGTEERS